MRTEANAPWRVLGVERAAAVVGLKPDTLLKLCAEGRGPKALIKEEDGTPVAWAAPRLVKWHKTRAIPRPARRR
jgi:hypothetical protein